MKIIYTVLVVCLAVFSQAAMADSPTSAFDDAPRSYGRSKASGHTFFNDMVKACYAIRVTQKGVDESGKLVNLKEEGLTLARSIESAIAPLLDRYEVPVSKCNLEDFQSSTMTTLEVSASITPQHGNHDLFILRVDSDLGEILKSTRVDERARVNLITADHVQVTDDKDQLHKPIVKESIRQVNWTVKLVTQQLQKQ